MAATLNWKKQFLYKDPSPPIILPFLHCTPSKVRREMNQWKAEVTSEFTHLSRIIKRNAINDICTRSMTESKECAVDNEKMYKVNKNPSLFYLVDQIDTMMTQSADIKNKISLIRKKTMQTRNEMSNIILKKDSELLNALRPAMAKLKKPSMFSTFNHPKVRAWIFRKNALSC